MFNYTTALVFSESTLRVLSVVGVIIVTALSAFFLARAVSKDRERQKVDAHELSQHQVVIVNTGVCVASPDGNSGVPFSEVLGHLEGITIKGGQI